jgi:poly(3-hydroxyalkanoate) synthetase
VASILVDTIVPSDIQFWNADTTRLPAAIHAEQIGIFENCPSVHPGQMEVLGRWSTPGTCRAG